MKTYKVIIEEDGTQFWHNENNQLHREDGPAVVYKNGSQSWYINDKPHREDGPAIIGKDYQAWWVNGKLHREDGPAIVREDGYKQWYINGEQLTEQEFNNRTKPCSGKIVVVDGIEYTLT